jgi:hypothetical protein
MRETVTEKAATPEAIADATGAVQEVAATPSPHVTEAIALGVCADVLSGLPRLTQRRVIEHLREMFDGPTSLNTLLSLVVESTRLREELQRAQELLPQDRPDA